MRRQIRALRNQVGISLVETLVVAAAAVSTGVSAYVIFNQTLQGESNESSQLAFVQSVNRLDRYILQPGKCMEALFRQPGDPDAGVPALSQRKERQEVLGLRLRDKIRTSRSEVEVSKISLLHKKDLGRDVHLLEFQIEGSIARKAQGTLTVTEAIPIFARVIQTSSGPQVGECTPVGDAQPARFLAYLGSNLELARITNQTNFQQLLRCAVLAFDVAGCFGEAIVWGTQIPAPEPSVGSEPTSGGGPVVSPIQIPSIFNPMNLPARGSVMRHPTDAVGHGGPGSIDADQVSSDQISELTGGLNPSADSHGEPLLDGSDDGSEKPSDGK